MFEFGKKIITDTAALLTGQTNIRADIATVDALHDVPTASGTSNVIMRDVIGNRTDGHNDTTVIGRIKQVNEHIHAVTCLYPVLLAPVGLTKAAGAYADFPATTTIIPAGTTVLDFDIHWLIISALSANGDYVIRLYQGEPGQETVIATKSAVRNAVQSQEGSIPVITPIITAGKRISAAMTSGNAGADTCAIKVEYHTY